jgi:hypothetical protein
MTIRKLISLMIFAGIVSSCSTRDRQDQQTQTPATEKFMTHLSSYCGQTLSGEIFNDSESPALNGQSIAFNFSICKEDEIRIEVLLDTPQKKTIILTLLNNEILLKHDVREPDLTPVDMPMYGGFSSNDGNENAQVFPVHNFGHNLWPEMENHSWEICINEDEHILEYMELMGDVVKKHYILRLTGH